MQSREHSMADLLKYIRQHRIVRSREITERGWARKALQRLENQGLITRISRGTYALADDNSLTENRSLAEACKRVPDGIVCLLSALQFHGITTQMPHEVWLAIPQAAHTPDVEYPPLRIMRFSGAAYTAGIERYSLENVNVQIYNPAKTIVDCFKHRNKVGLDVFLEALRAYVSAKESSMDDLWTYAKLRGVSKTIRPYLEAI